VARDNVMRGAGLRPERVSAPAPANHTPPSVSPDERALLAILVDCKTARTVGQLCSVSGLDREQIIPALAGLRSKGLVSRYNTVVESFAARFPGIEV